MPDMRSITCSISDLFAFVKTFDEEFSPKPVSPMVLNEDGTPKVFYHGTNAEFDAFSSEELLYREGSFFFAENEEDAEAYGKNVIKAYLSAENLANYDQQPSEFYRLKDKREQVEYLKDLGYDGWYDDMDSGEWGEVSVFSPTQIKSATDNLGTYSRYTPNIYRSINMDLSDRILTTEKERSTFEKARDTIGDLHNRGVKALANEYKEAVLLKKIRENAKKLLTKQEGRGIIHKESDDSRKKNIRSHPAASVRARLLCSIGVT